MQERSKGGGMEFQILDPMIVQWTSLAARFGEVARDFEATQQREGLSRKDVKLLQVIATSRQKLVEITLENMSELRRALIEWNDEKSGPMIGDLSASYALQSLEVMRKREEDRNGTPAEKDARAFADCRNLAIQLRAELLESWETEKKASVLSSKVMEKHRQDAIRRIPDPKTIDDEAVRVLSENSLDLLKYMSSSSSPVHAVDAQYLEFKERLITKTYCRILDEVIKDQIEAIVRHFDWMLELGGLGASLIGIGIGVVVPSPPGVGSAIGAFLGYITKGLARGRLREKQKRREEGYRSAAIVQSTLFLLPFIGCVLGHLRISEYVVRLRVMRQAAEISAAEATSPLKGPPT
jgi:hypothetical protein